MPRLIWLIVILIFLSLLLPFFLLAALLHPQPTADSLTGAVLFKNQLTNVLPSPLPTEVSFIAVGDISLSRNVAFQIKKTNDPLLPFRQLSDLLKSTDFNMANLESPFSGKSYFGQTGSLVFNAPPENIQGLIEYNFKALNIANNHALDQGLAGLENTIKYLSDHNLQVFGAGKNQEAAWQAQIIQVKDIKIGFLGAAYASINDNGKITNEYVARIEDEDKLKAALDNLKPQVDLVVVNIHAGIEYTTKPNPSQIKFAHAAIDWGADLVIGHHPHWVQAMEKYQGKYIFYSLGNFIFDQMWSQPTREGLVLKINVSKQNNLTQIKQIKLIPIIIDNYSTPRLADPTEAATILDLFKLTDETIIVN